jgi:acyl-CoA synthetase (AMP-forming)/AMP-acid ligase II
MAERFPDEVAFRVIGEGHLTFGQWDGEANRLARGMAGLGIGRGDRVAIRLQPSNAVRWVIAYAAIHRSGAVAVPLDPRLAPAEVEGMFVHAHVVAQVADGDRVDDAVAADRGPEDGFPLDLVIDATRGDRVPSAAEPPLPAGARGDRPRCLRWDDVLDDDGSAYQVPVDDDDLADIMFTSGTTGRPKGVAVRHANASTVPNGAPSWSGQLWLHASPLTTFAGLAFVYAPMKLGMACVYQPRFDADRWLDVIESDRPQALFLVPSMVQLLLGQPRFEEVDFSSVAICSVGSAPLAPAAIDRLQARMPDAVVSNNYGMTEAGSVYCVMPKGEAVRRPGSVGRPVPPAEVRCVGADGEGSAADGYGEIELRIPGRPREYFEDPEATATTWVDGWLRTGDIGRIDEDGYLYIVGRAKDVIIRGGSNVYAVDVESVILSHPGVEEAAVIGIPHDVLGEDLAAVVVVRPGWELGSEELRRHCLDSLAAYKVPRRWEFTDGLPRNPAGKVLKEELRSRFADGIAVNEGS